MQPSTTVKVTMMTNEEFYGPFSSDGLRLGDVVTGFTCSIPHLKLHPDPSDGLGGDASLTIDVIKPQYAAVLTPCCSIGGDRLVVGPLRRIRPDWLENPYFRDNFLCINEKIDEEHLMTPEQWGRKSPEEQEAIRRQPPAWTLLEYFVYAPGGLLASYPVSYKHQAYDTNYYIVDFRSPMLVHHDLLADSAGHTHGEKILQLSPKARDCLRLKLAYYYSRSPQEDTNAMNMQGQAGTCSATV